MKNPVSRVSAFTLIELLVAMAITLVLAGMMVAVTSGTLDVWQRAQDQHAQNTAAKQALDAIEADLQTVTWRNDTTTYFAAEILDTAEELQNHGWLLDSIGPIKPANGGSLLPLPPDDPVAGQPLITAARFGLSGVWLRFVGNHIDPGKTVPVVISYQVCRRPVVGDAAVSNPAPTRYSLYRTAVAAGDSFNSGYDVARANFSSSTNTPTSTATSAFRNRNNVINPSHANLLASNVVDFGCWLYHRESDGVLTRIYPQQSGDKSHAATGNSTNNSSRMPSVAEIAIRVLSDRGARLLEAIESGRALRPPEFSDDATWWWSVVEKHSASFYRRIELRGNGQ